jgi:integrase
MASLSISYRHICQAGLKRLLLENGRRDLVSRLPKLSSPQPREIVVPEAEFERMMRVARPELELVLLLAHEVGLRAKTALMLNREQCDFDNGRIGGITKGGSRYSLPMTKRLRDRLQWFCAAAADAQEPLHAAFRPFRKLMSTGALRKAMSVARREAGLTSCWGLHDLRRTAARAMYERTKDLRKVQSFLGHRMLWTTCWYLGNAIQLTSEDVERNVA